MLELMKYSKDIPYSSFYADLINKFRIKGFSRKVQHSDDYDGNMQKSFDWATSIILDAAEEKVRKGSLGSYDDKWVDCAISAMSDGMSFSSIDYAESKLPKTWDESYAETRFEYAFWGSILLREEIALRFEKAYEVWRNSCSWGEKTKIERTGLECATWYFTSFDSYFFAINPKEGLVLKSKNKLCNSINRLCILDADDVDYDKVVDIESNTMLAYIDKITGTLYSYMPMDTVGSDMKKSEKEKRIAEGKKQKRTCWLSVYLGNYKGSNSYMRVHTLICLLVYGLKVMGPAIIGSNSIFTIDHINNIHDDNRIENLQLVSRKSNSVKRASDLQLFDYFCYFNSLPQPKQCIKELVSKLEVSA